MDWGYECGFQVLFSTEERVRAGRHTYSVAYDAVHDYSARFQALALRSDPAQCSLSR